MAGTETNAHPEYGERVSAPSDPLVYGTWAVSDRVTAYGAGMMAQSARLPLIFLAGSRQQILSLGARLTALWDYLETHSDEDGENLHCRPDTSHLLYASLQLSI